MHFQLFGLTVHTGPAEQAHKSKSEVGFFAATYATYDHIDTKVHPPILFRNADGDEADFSDIKTGDGTAVPVVFKFKYLGSMVQTSGAGVLDVGNFLESRIKKAGGAFGALRQCLFSSQQVNARTKAKQKLVQTQSFLIRFLFHLILA